jgi:hypothetical protein
MPKKRTIRIFKFKAKFKDARGRERIVRGQAGGKDEEATRERVNETWPFLELFDIILKEEKVCPSSK